MVYFHFNGTYKSRLKRKRKKKSNAWKGNCVRWRELNPLQILEHLLSWPFTISFWEYFSGRWRGSLALVWWGWCKSWYSGGWANPGVKHEDPVCSQGSLFSSDTSLPFEEQKGVTCFTIIPGISLPNAWVSPFLRPLSRCCVAPFRSMVLNFLLPKALSRSQHLWFSVFLLNSWHKHENKPQCHFVQQQWPYSRLVCITTQMQLL